MQASTAMSQFKKTDTSILSHNAKQNEQQKEYFSIEITTKMFFFIHVQRSFRASLTPYLFKQKHSEPSQHIHWSIGERIRRIQSRTVWFSAIVIVRRERKRTAEGMQSSLARYNNNGDSNNNIYYSWIITKQIEMTKSQQRHQVAEKKQELRNRTHLVLIADPAPV